MRYKGIEIYAVCRIPHLYEVKNTKPSKIVLGHETNWDEGPLSPVKYISHYVAVVGDDTVSSHSISGLEKIIQARLNAKD